MKKRLVLMLIIMILINTIIPNFIYADEDTDGDVDSAVEQINKHISAEDVLKHDVESGKDSAEQIFTEGTADVTPSNSGTRTEKIGETATSSSTVAGKLCALLVTLPATVNNVMTLFINSTEPDDSKYRDKFTIENLVFNRYKLFDIDFFKFDENSKNTNDILKSNVAKWYFGIRNLAIVGSLMVLIYIGIRMVISTVAVEQAKYKKMFVNWLISFMLVFVMHYIVIAMIELQNWMLNVIGEFVEGQGFEEYIINNTEEAFANVAGWDCVAVTIQFYVLVFFQIKFFLSYFKRFLKVGFLLVIAPLVTITYSIDAIGDGKAQAYSAWLKQITFAIFIQVIHAVVYAIFIISAAEIAKAAPIMGALLLMALSRTEKIALKTLKLSGKGGIGDEKLLDKIKR